eukprot:352210-Chlamydomonas_euryale.AAC.9
MLQADKAHVGANVDLLAQTALCGEKGNAWGRHANFGPTRFVRGRTQAANMFVDIDEADPSREPHVRTSCLAGGGQPVLRRPQQGKLMGPSYNNDV